MFRSLWGKSFLLLVLVSAVGLSAAVLLRGMMLRDFRSFLEGERLDHVYIVTAALEGSWERNSGWDETSLADTAAMALMLGMQIQVLDDNGSPLLGTDGALEGLLPLMRRRVLSFQREPSPIRDEFIPYPLFLGGERIGTVKVAFVENDRSGLFIQRSGKFLLLSFLILGGLTLFLSFSASRRLAAPIRALSSRARDLTEGKRVERVPVKSADEIGQLTRVFNDMAANLQIQENLRRKLVSNVAHELRTPLAAMRAELEAMIDGVEPTGEDQLRSLYEETGRLAFLLDGIDDLTQAQASSLNLERREMDVMPLLGNIRDRFAVSAREKGVKVVLEGGKPVHARADADKLSRILINLVSNALRATGEGGQVTLRAEAGKKGTSIEVADTGGGISVEDMPHILERFFKGKGGGLGLGLSIVKELVDAHEGRIEVRSEAGKGTTVTVTLPGEKN